MCLHCSFKIKAVLYRFHNFHENISLPVTDSEL